MPNSRQAFTVRSLHAIYSAGDRLAEHSHDWHQFLFAAEGAMTLTVTDPEQPEELVVPPTRGAWIPADAPHRVLMHGRVDMRTLYFPSATGPEVIERRRGVASLDVGPLLRQLILRTVDLGLLRRGNARDEALTLLLLEELAESRSALPSLPLPRDPRAVRAADSVRSAPRLDARLERLAAPSGASPRTLERLFREETGLSFGRWRRRAVMLAASRWLTEPGATVEGAALRAGYESTSAFIAAFRDEIGKTPGALARTDGS